MILLTSTKWILFRISSRLSLALMLLTLCLFRTVLNFRFLAGLPTQQDEAFSGVLPTTNDAAFGSYHRGHEDHRDRYHRWGTSSEGINLTAVIDFIVTIAENDITRYQNQFGPIPSKIERTSSGEISVSFLGSVIRRRQDHMLRLRLRQIAPFVQEALRTELSENRFPALYTSLAHEADGFPLIFAIDDFLGCLSPVYDGYYECLDDEYSFNNKKKKKCNISESDDVRPWTVGPQFTLSSSPHCEYAFPIPSYSVLSLAKNTSQEWDEEFQTRNSTYPWDTKVPKAIWRGSMTGTGVVQNRTRFYLGVIGKNNTDIMDVAFPPKHSNVVRRLIRRGQILTAPRIPSEEFQTAKAIIDVDGNSWSERFPRLLCMNSVVIKVNPNQIDYFAPSLRPFYHYLPADMSNLTDVVRYAVSNKSEYEMRSIIANANDWCRTYMIRKRVMRDFLSVLDGYIKELDRFDRNWTEVWKEEWKRRKDCLSPFITFK